MRLGGSVAFIVTNLASGALLSVLDVDAIFWFVAAALISSTAVPSPLPVTPPAARALDDRERPEPPRPGSSSPIPAFLALLFVGGLIQASHAVLYSFGSIHWRSLGFSGFDIGIFWATGCSAKSRSSASRGQSSVPSARLASWSSAAWRQ